MKKALLLLLHEESGVDGSVIASLASPRVAR
jgi:hypothetical protein